MYTLIKKNLMTMLLFGLIPFNGFAHDVDGVLGPSASASDYYQIQCYDDKQGAGPSKELELTLLTMNTGAPELSMQVSREETNTVYSATDPIGGDSVSSPPIVAAHGDGYYYVMVNKTLEGVQRYHINYHCLSDDGHAGTEIVTIQNQ
jgi:hypothetical protein